MSLAALIRQMAAAGAPPEAIALAVEAIEAAQAKDAERRAKAAEKKRRQRAGTNGGHDGDSPGTVLGHDGDKSETVPPSPDGPSSLPHTPTQHPLNPPSTSAESAAREPCEVVEFRLLAEPKAQPPPKHKARKTLLPADFTLTPELLDYAISKGHTDGSARRDFEEFVGHARANGRECADWIAACQNWFRKTLGGFGQVGSPRPGGYRQQDLSRVEAVDRAITIVRNKNLRSQ